jgi:oligogalacturonide lyase
MKRSRLLAIVVCIVVIASGAGYYSLLPAEKPLVQQTTTTMSHIEKEPGLSVRHLLNATSLMFPTVLNVTAVIENTNGRSIDSLDILQTMPEGFRPSDIGLVNPDGSKSSYKPATTSEALKYLLKVPLRPKEELRLVVLLQSTPASVSGNFSTNVKGIYDGKETEAEATDRIVVSEIFKYRDPSTGREVWRLTDPKVLSSHAYFYERDISRDNSFIVFASNRTSSRQLFLTRLPSGEIIELTHEKWLSRYSFTMSPDDSELFYVATGENGIALKALRLSDLSVREVYQFAQDGRFHSEIGISSDGKLLVFVEIWASDDDAGKEFPLCRIVVSTVDGSRSWVALEEKYNLSHPQFRPLYNDMIMFSHDEQREHAIWFVDIDGSNSRSAALAKGLGRIIHQFWLADGSKILYLYFPKWYGEDATVRVLDPVTLREQTLMPVSGWSHFESNRDGTLLVGDSITTPYLFLANVTARREFRLCEHGTSWKDYAALNPGVVASSQDSHPHPAFSDDGNMIIFNSDKDGLPAVYLVLLRDVSQGDSSGRTTSSPATKQAASVLFGIPQHAHERLLEVVDVGKSLTLSEEKSRNNSS